jgi:YHS domain-containing protein
MKPKQLLVNFVRPCSLLLLCLFSSFQLGAANSDPLRQLVKAKPAGKALQFSPTFEGRGDGVHTCPVTGEKLTTLSLKAEYFGRTVYFCCEGCLKSAQRTPEKYVKPTMTEQQQAVKAYIAKVPQDPDGAEFCNE